MVIHHAPLGDEHPYAGRPEERSPRYPLAGQPISIGFTLELKIHVDVEAATTGAASPTVRWSVDGGTQRVTPAQPAAGGMAGVAAANGAEYYSGPGLGDSAGPSGDQAEVAAAAGPGGSPADSGERPDDAGGAADGRFAADTAAVPLLPRRWTAAIPPCPAGAVLTYCIKAGSEATGQFTVTIGETTAAGSGIRREGDTIELSFADGATATLALRGSGIDSGPSLVIEACRLMYFPGEQPDRLVLTYESPANERFYGFGERFDRLDRRGTVVDTRVYEQYLEQQDRSYIPVPYFFSSVGYGHYLNTARNVVYDLAASDPGRWSVAVELPDDRRHVDIWIGEGTPGEILDEFTREVGRPAVPPGWAFGPWMSANEWNSQERVLEVVERTRELDIPASVIVIEAWSDESTFYVWNDAEYSPVEGGERLRYGDFRFPGEGRWPDPKGMVERLHEYGLRVLLWQIPVYKGQPKGDEQHDTDWDYMVERGYAVGAGDGSPYRVRPPWFHDSLVLDVTNGQALEWWFSKRRYLLEEIGIDGFKTDGGEHVWGYTPRYSDGRGGADLWNEYPKRYVDAYHREAARLRDGDAITFSRAGFTGSWGSPMHWCGDQPSTWSALLSVYRAVLNAGLSGLPLIGWDIGGFSGPIPDPELYMRSAAAAVFSPLFQYHSEYNDHRAPIVDRTPWNIAKQFDAPWLVDAFRRAAKLREALRDVIVEAAAEASRSGRPLMRPLFFDIPDDARSWDAWDQYWFAQDVMVCPVFAPGIRQRSVYLPPGAWLEPATGRSFEGERTITVDTPADSIPVFVREPHSTVAAAAVVAGAVASYWEREQTYPQRNVQ